MVADDGQRGMLQDAGASIKEVYKKYTSTLEPLCLLVVWDDAHLPDKLKWEVW